MYIYMQICISACDMKVEEAAVPFVTEDFPTLGAVAKPAKGGKRDVKKAASMMGN